MLGTHVRAVLCVHVCVGSAVCMPASACARVCGALPSRHPGLLFQAVPGRPTGSPAAQEGQHLSLSKPLKNDPFQREGKGVVSVGGGSEAAPWTREPGGQRQWRSRRCPLGVQFSAPVCVSGVLSGVNRKRLRCVKNISCWLALSDFLSVVISEPFYRSLIAEIGGHTNNSSRKRKSI